MFFLQLFQSIWSFCFRLWTNQAAVCKTPPPLELLGQNQALAQNASSINKDHLFEEMGTLNQALRGTRLTPERLTMALTVLTQQVCVYSGKNTLPLFCVLKVIHSVFF